MKKYSSKSSSSAQNLTKNPNKLNEVESHEYYRVLIEKALVPIVHANKEANQKKEEFLPTPLQQYHIDVFYRSASLFEAVKRLYDIPYFIMSNPPFTSMANHGVTPEDWFVYHYSNYRVIATGIYDTALIVVNFLLRIDLPAKDCNNKTIRTNPVVCKNKIEIPLKELDTILGRYRKDRNLYVHRSERPDIEFVDQLKGYRFLKEAKEKGFYKGELPDQKIANALFLEQRDKKRKELQAETDIICSAILNLLDVWLPVYLETLDSFEEG